MTKFIMEAVHIVHGAGGAIFQPGTKFRADQDRADFLVKEGAAKKLKEIQEKPAEITPEDQDDDNVGDGDGTGDGDDEGAGDGTGDPDEAAQKAAAKAAAKAAKAQQ